MIILTIILAITFFILALIHFNWAIGNKWGLNLALPTKENGERPFSPGIFGSLIVGVGLLTFSFLYLIKSSLIIFDFEPIVNYVYWFIPTIFSIRTIGDFKYVGLFKKVKTTKFAKADSKIFIPLCFVLAILGFTIAST